MLQNNTKTLTYIAIVFLILSPLISANLFITPEIANEGGGAVGVGVAFIVFLGIPFIILVGIITAVILKLLHYSKKIGYLLGFLLPAFLVNLFILI
ncbi:MAG: hypothetical protein V4702_01515 [Patescibacteria group bacterium]